MRKRLGELLVEQRLLTNEQLQECLKSQRVTKEPLGSVVVKKKLLTTEKLLMALGHQYGVNVWFLDQWQPSPEALKLVPTELCRRYQALPVEVSGRMLTVAMRNPNDIDAIDALRSITGLRIEPVLADEALLAKTIDQKPNLKANQKSKAVDSFVSQAMTEIDSRRMPVDKQITTELETRPVIGLINELVSEAVTKGATDIHLEPRENRLDVRYRIDGMLVDVRKIPIELMPMVVARIKIMSDMDVVEYRLSQDGRFDFELDGRLIDMRVSVVPNLHGQRIVLRILDRSALLRNLDNLGFSATNLQVFRKMISRPYGLVLVTGPTGSGKTTTVYAALNSLNTPMRNIMSCEDPIEYAIDGVNQLHVKEKIGLTFATQLRSMLRQDPDILFVGEIRDRETAEMAIRASLTGHLVISTLHCNDAPSAIPRLLDMGVDPFLLSTSLVGVVAQRLLRTLCTSCRKLSPIDAEVMEAIEELGHAPQTTAWNGVGCPDCLGTGYRGRISVHEMLPITDEIASMIAARGSNADIREAAKPYGFRSLREDAIDRVTDGLTSFVEARRLIAYGDYQVVNMPELRLHAA